MGRWSHATQSGHLNAVAAVLNGRTAFEAMVWGGLKKCGRGPRQCWRTQLWSVRFDGPALQQPAFPFLGRKFLFATFVRLALFRFVRYITRALPLCEFRFPAASPTDGIPLLQGTLASVSVRTIAV